ncbi:alpha/beta fold hydrolase [Motiliproteus sp. MSK22-1]|uniref:alpha/beta fold hydrolase n=1 Tax=Motiliproteus sp. MSK22-1 TaxID=1897630 RepID=UPI000976BF7A|nr:alpha/beta hydrolase [Motiliproteus sp. MSK22-1]OMH33802.1 hypothetical protein BGP75_12500 [Motiliproteus sp. MSK22-1]
MVNPQQIVIETPWYQIAAKAWGPETGHKVLAVHGWLDNAASFDFLAPLLPDTRFIAIDLPGHGLSSHRPPGVPYHFVDYIPDVIAAADGLGWQRFSFVSHSLGAGVSSFVSALLPDRIEKLVMIDGLGPYAADPSKAPQSLAASIKQMGRLPTKRPPVYSDKNALIDARVRVGDLNRESVRCLINRSSMAYEGGWTWTSDPRLRFSSPLYLTEAQVLAHLQAIQAPTLLINGDRGIIDQRPSSQQRCAAIKNLTVKTVSGGHHLHMENPEPVATEIRAFLR